MPEAPVSAPADLAVRVRLKFSRTLTETKEVYMQHFLLSLVLFCGLFSASKTFSDQLVKENLNQYRSYLYSKTFSDQSVKENSPGALREGLFPDRPANSVDATGTSKSRKKTVVKKHPLPPEIVRRVTGATKLLIGIYNNGMEERQGTGFFISPNLLVTAYHLIEGREESLRNGSAGLAVGLDDLFNFKKIRSFSEEYDIALIEVERTDGKDEETLFLKLNPEAPQEGDLVYTWGYAGGILSFFESEITFLDKEWSKLPKSLFNNPFSHFGEIKLVGFESKKTRFLRGRRFSGMSGAAVINNKGEVTGVHTSSYYSNPDFGVDIYFNDYATGISPVRELLESVGATLPGEGLWDKFKETVSF